MAEPMVLDASVGHALTETDLARGVYIPDKGTGRCTLPRLNFLKEWLNLC